MRARVEWVDIAKGVCIILVVMMHSTLGVEAAAGGTGWMHPAVAFAAPFRMPDFFLVAGLFLSARINAPAWLYFDRRVLHFAYFYVLWLTIQFALKAPGMAAEAGWDGVLRLYLLSFVEPFGTLWFIYHLALFSVAVRLLRGVPAPLVWIAAAALQVAPIHTGTVLVDEFASFFVFFYSGYLFAPWIFRFADHVRARPIPGLAGLALWAVVNGAAVWLGWVAAPGLSLALGFAGALAIVAFAVLIAETLAGRGLAWLGERSIVVYLAFFLPMAATRAALLMLAPSLGVGAISLLVTLAGVAGPLVLHAIVERTGRGRFLFERPAFARLDGGRPALRLAPAAERPPA